MWVSRGFAADDRRYGILDTTLSLKKSKGEVAFKDSVRKSWKEQSRAAGSRRFLVGLKSCLLWLACKEFERLWHEVRVKLEHCPVSGIRIDDEFAIRKTSRQIAGVTAWYHAVAVAIGDKYGLMDS